MRVARYKLQVFRKKRKDEIAVLSRGQAYFAPRKDTEGLKLTIFTYEWGKCVKPVGKYLLESLV